MYDQETQCVQVSCSNENYKSTSNYSKTFFILNKNQSRTFKEAFCSYPSENYQNWFQETDFSTTLFDAPNSAFAQGCGTQLNLSTFISNHTKELLQESACSESMHCSVPLELQYTAEAVKRGKQTAEIIFGFSITIGLLAVLGNLAVIHNCLSFLLRKNLRRTLEAQIYRLLILHLSLADLLMGCYVLGILISSLTFTAKRENNELLKKEGGTMCLVLGFVNFISSQISITAVVTITALRLFSVVYPFKTIRFKRILMIVVATWIFWLGVACIPIIDDCLLTTVFTDEVTITDFKTKKHATVRYFNLLFLVNNFLKKINDKCQFASEQGYKLNHYPSWSILIDVAKKLDLVPLNVKQNLINLGYYNSWWVCTMKFFLSYKNPSSIFTLPILFLNVFSFCFIFLAQLIIVRKTSNCSQSPASCLGRRQDERGNLPGQEQRESENKKIRRRMFIVVVTNFCCYIPVSLLAIDFYRRSFSSDSCEFFVYRIWIERNLPNLILIVIPLNSALNPFIYSCRFWEPLRKFFLKCCHQKFLHSTLDTTPSNSSGSCNVASASPNFNVGLH